jgi:superfamily II DNA/RNA helicase
MQHVPAVRQTMLFSATMSREIEKLTVKFLKNPERIQIGQEIKPAERVTHDALMVTNTLKNKALVNELSLVKGSVIIFTRTKHRADRVARDLVAGGHPAARIHSGRSQAQRQSALEAFRGGKFRILVATDIAARGIDVPGVAQVINFDLPETGDDYIHRVGRTARAGAEGRALSFVTPEQRRDWQVMSRQFGMIKLRQLQNEGGSLMNQPLSSGQKQNQMLAKDLGQNQNQAQNQNQIQSLIEIETQRAYQPMDESIDRNLENQDRERRERHPRRHAGQRKTQGGGFGFSKFNQHKPKPHRKGQGFKSFAKADAQGSAHNVNAQTGDGNRPMPSKHPHSQNPRSQNPPAHAEHNRKMLGGFGGPKGQSRTGGKPSFSNGPRKSGFGGGNSASSGGFNNRRPQRGHFKGGQQKGFGGRNA